jgi:hypothetical protein
MSKYTFFALVRIILVIYILHHKYDLSELLRRACSARPRKHVFQENLT